MSIEYKLCPSCNKENRNIANYCRFCGEYIEDVICITGNKEKETQDYKIDNEDKIEIKDAKQEEVHQDIKNQKERQLGEEGEKKEEKDNKELSKYSSALSFQKDYFGLDRVTEQLKRYIDTLIFNEKHQEEGINNKDKSYTLIFSGAIGTGKSTVCKSFVKNLKKTSLLKSKKIVEVDEKKFSSVYPSKIEIQDYIKNEDIGILVIENIEDCSYLYEIIHGIKDNPHKTICILISQQELVDSYFESNPADYKFAEIVKFSNPDCTTLAKILKAKLVEQGFILSKEVEDALAICVMKVKQDGKCNQSNGYIITKYIINEMKANIKARLDNTGSDNYKEILLEDFPCDLTIKSEDELMKELNSMIGLDNVKESVKELITTIKENKRLEENGFKTSMPNGHIVFTGNPGTGKTTVARILGELFYSIGLLPTNNIVEVDRSGLVDRFVGGTALKVQACCDEAMGGVLFIDEAYTLCQDGEHDSYGQEAIDTLLKRMEDDKDKFVVIVAGYEDKMNTFLESNPGLKGRFTYFFHLKDYNEDELFQLFNLYATNGGFKIEEDAKELIKLQIKDIYDNKPENFDNARAMRKIYNGVISRKNNRVGKIKDREVTVEDFGFIKKDDIDYAPKHRLSEEEIYKELDNLIGMAEVKNIIKSVAKEIKFNKFRLEMGQKTENPSFHIVFTGNPGTGKTTIARLLGKLFFVIGLLPTDKFIEVKRQDLVAEFEGQTAIKVSKACEKAMGGVLFIDEAYTLTKNKDAYGQEAVDTLLPIMEDKCGQFIVIVAGYKDDMEDFLDSNQGLRSRFYKKIHIPDYTDDELLQLFCLFAKKDSFIVGDDALELLKEQIKSITQCKTKDFSNARTMKKLYASVRERQSNRLMSLKQQSLTLEEMTLITKEDIDYKPQNKVSADDIFKELDCLIGMANVKKTIHDIYETVVYNHQRMEKGLKYEIPGIHIVLTGNSGTGKTTVARLFGKIFHSIGLLPTDKFVEVNREHLVGKYLGETAKNVGKACEKAMGGVLFIDEAYALTRNKDSYGQEAVDTLVPIMENKRGQFVVIVAGYDYEMNEFLKSNPGLRSRFSHFIHIEDYNPQELFEIFSLYAKNDEYILDEGAKEYLASKMNSIWETRENDFGNARAIKEMFNKVKRRLALRVKGLSEEEKTKEAMSTILKEDFEEV